MIYKFIFVFGHITIRTLVSKEKPLTLKFVYMFINSCLQNFLLVVIKSKSRCTVLLVFNFSYIRSQ